ncbi:MAG: alanine racemase [Mariprofundales bacterium]|nr:alanine racemase [Mariprofundales bacterium]
MSRPVIARMSSEALIDNYNTIRQLAGEAVIMAVVKADGYGHGMVEAATRLWDAGCDSFAVTDASEGVALRQALQEHARQVEESAGSGEESGRSAAEITLLSGIFDDEDTAAVVAHRLVPVIHDKEEVARLRRARFNGRLWLKMETGMNRLGAEQARQLLDRCFRCRWPVAGLLSHLACADEADHPLNAQQAERMRSYLNLMGPGLSGSLLNSAGLITMPQFAFDVVRPGIALYGAQPTAESTCNLHPVMSLEAEIMQIHRVDAGAVISYGGEFVADNPMRVAVVAAGYGDGIPRRASSCGGVVIHKGKKLPMVGRVCMDYTIIDVSGITAKVGDRVQFWGDMLPVDEVATSCETISYELFTGVNARVPRLWS